MASATPPLDGASPRRRQRGLMPPEVINVAVPALKAGIWTGMAGVATGVGTAIAFDKRPIGSGVAMGCEWFALGSTYWLFRSLAIASLGGQEQVTPREKVMASALGGSAGGAVAGLMRGPHNIIPCIAFYGLLGGGGQMVANVIASRPPKPPQEKRSWLQSKWLPMRMVTDEEYEETINESILRVEADIAICEERIASIRASAQQDDIRSGK
ncbi:hypothetical protein L249_5282 [Ophiocordyceps polyrhachis-furcata BCC 54312]|uniref:Uncharacterized protein n=1 Tax=Ophiocordyceps polyrhachis-furcata BCC 54312 TaxID=1330021 RepID=A0A367L972_9HYPO|nr:hypothetical protein L249_5282 [Ophiocordyceps polyrhachis-furcata BCC 54312]